LFVETTDFNVKHLDLALGSAVEFETVSPMKFVRLAENWQRDYSKIKEISRLHAYGLVTAVPP